MAKKAGQTLKMAGEKIDGRLQLPCQQYDKIKNARHYTNLFSYVIINTAKMVMPVNKPRILKKRRKRFIRHQSDRYMRVGV
jgi:hypothetical protein